MTCRALLACAALLAAGVCIAQAPAPAGATVPQMYVSSALPGDSSRTLNVVVIDPPLILTREASGRLHLALARSSRAVFRNGLYQTQGRDYDVENGEIRWRAAVNADDTISVVALP